jgi:hypothetical protein
MFVERYHQEVFFKLSEKPGGILLKRVVVLNKSNFKQVGREFF